MITICIYSCLPTCGRVHGWEAKGVNESASVNGINASDLGRRVQNQMVGDSLFWESRRRSSLLLFLFLSSLTIACTWSRPSHYRIRRQHRIRSIDRSTAKRVNRRSESVYFTEIRMIMNFSITCRLFEQVLESALGFGIWRQPARKRQHVVDIQRASRKLLDWHRKCLSFRMQFGYVTLPPRLSSFSS